MRQTFWVKKWKTIRRWLMRGLIALVVLVTAAWWIENWRGARAWEKAKARAEAAGMSLNRNDYAGPEIPDEQNLLLNPVFAEEFYMEGDGILRDWSRLPGLKEARVLRNPRPYAGKSFQYRDWFREEISEEEARERVAQAARGFEERLSRLIPVILNSAKHELFAEEDATGDLLDGPDWIGGIRRLSRCLDDSAGLAIREGDGDRALDRIRTLFHLSERCHGPTLLSVLISNAVKQTGLTLIWEGLRKRVWNASQLERLVSEIPAPSYQDRLARGLSYEISYGIAFLRRNDLREHFDGIADQLESLGLEEFVDRTGEFEFFLYYGGPQGWCDQRRAFLVNFHLDLIECSHSSDFEGMGRIATTLSVSEWSPLHEVAAGLKRMARSPAHATWEPETVERICRIALAAEKEFARSGNYPIALEELVFDFPVTDLTDPKNRELAYELGPKGRPQIWSQYQEELREAKMNDPSAPGWEPSLRWQFWSEE